MITGLHAMFYSESPAETRAFIRDVLGMRSCDVGEGWLIFEAPPADIGVHPPNTHIATGTHVISFSCDDIQTTVAELKERGVVFTREVRDDGYGLTTEFEVPGGVRCDLYEPRYVLHFE